MHAKLFCVYSYRSNAVMAYLFVLFIIYIKVRATPACDLPCPPDKPYCSEVGCVFECPEPFYINGTSCVSDCGKWFVDENRHCVASCPDIMVYKETLKPVMNSQRSQYLERECTTCNGSGQFVANETCVKVCPADNRYIDKNKCISQCPMDRPFKISFEIYEMLHYKCVKKCPRVEENSFCRDSCPDNKIMSQSSCVEKCPPYRPFLYWKSCETQCPYNNPSAGYENKTCVHNKCPDDRPFVVNSTCVETCPSTDPFVFPEKCSDYRFNRCINNCDGKYRLNNSCVDICPLPAVTVNDSCLQRCPSNAPYSMKETKEIPCPGGRRYSVMIAVCVDICPQNRLIWNNTCISSCPNEVPLFGNECTELCPVHHPYRRNYTTTKDCSSMTYEYRNIHRCREVKTVLKCSERCPSESYIFNNTCVSFCPFPLFQKDKECVQTCPVSSPYFKYETVSVNIWLHDYSYYYWPFRSVSQKKTIRKCIGSCDDRMLIFNMTCVQKCPLEDYSYIHNKTCLKQECETEYSEKTSSGILCTEKCKPQQLVLNKTCVESCPNTHVYFNGTCIDHCPESHLLTSEFVVGETCDKSSCIAQFLLEQCVERCPGEFFENNSTCVSFCHIPLYTVGDKCFSECPFDKPYTIKYSKTVAKWSKDGNRYKKTNTNEYILECVANCPADKVLFGSICENSCPLNYWFITNGTCGSKNCKTKYTFYTSAGIRCFEECPQYLYVYNNTCFSQCPDNLYAFNRTCIKDCPPTDTLINDEIFGENQHNCTWSSELMCADNLLYIKQCRRECPENKFLHNNTCLNYCFENTSVFNRTCVIKCPESHPFTKPSSVKILYWQTYSDIFGLEYQQSVNTCVEKCANDYPLRFEYTCVKNCPKASPYLFKNTTCVKKCPLNELLDIRTKRCVNTCEKDRGLFNHSCHYNCPEKTKYIFNSKCVSKCPPSHPVALKEDRFICRKACEDGKLFHGTECISSYDCEDPLFDYNGQCLHSCPDGMVWFENCKETGGAKIAALSLAVLFLVLIVCNRQGIMDYIHVVKLIYATEEDIKDIQMKQRKSYSKKTNKNEDEIPLREMFFHTGNDEEPQVELHNENIDNTPNNDFTRL